MTITEFGTHSGGQPVHRINLRNGGLGINVLTLGAALQGVWLDGVAHSLTLGSDRLADYEGDMRYHGVLVAPVVNRFTGGRAAIGGVSRVFETNQDGLHTLHSGTAGTHLKIWQIADVTDTAVSLTLTLPDGEGGFPGTRPLSATFSLPDAATLRLKIVATTDKPTLFNAANHSYWNLDGSPDWSGHRLQIDAARYLPTSPEFVPTGDICDVEGTAFDFRKPRGIAPGNPPLDNSFCLANTPRTLTKVLTLTGQSGVTMSVSTTEAAVQIYDGRNAIRPGHAPYEGLAIEAQNWPDAPNHAGFPSIALHPGQTYRQTTEWHFTAP